MASTPGNTIASLPVRDTIDLDNDIVLLASRDKYLSGDYHSRSIAMRDLC